MKTISAYNTAKIDNPNQEPIRVAAWAFTDGTTIYLTDRVWNRADGSIRNVFDSQLYEPLVISWGDIDLGALDPVLYEPEPAQADIVFFNNIPIGGTASLTSLFAIHAPQYSTITVYEFLYGASAGADLIPIFKGRFEDALNMTRPQVQVSFSGMDLDIVNKFTLDVVDITTYPEARLMDVGKMLPQVWGQASKVPYMGVSVGKLTTLAIDITDSETSITITDSDADFPSSGEAIIGDETVVYTGKSSGQLTGCVRGSYGTSAAAHTRGAIVQELKDISAYIIGHAVKAINDIYHADPETGRLIRQLSNFTKYTGQAGDQHETYPGKACITFLRYVEYIPIGGIVPFLGVDIPTGWSEFTDAIGRFIVGAGSTYALGETGGSTSVSGATDTGGSHSGTTPETEQAWAGASALGAGPYPYGSSPTAAGGHAHDIDFEYTPEHYQMKLIEAVAAQKVMPADGVLFLNDNSTPSGLVQSYKGDKLLKSGSVVYSAWDPTEKDPNVTLSNANLTSELNMVGWKGGLGLGVKSSGKWYFEVVVDNNQAVGYKSIIGVGFASWDYTTDFLGSVDYTWGADLQNGQTYMRGGVGSNLGDTFANGDIVMVALDQDSSPPGIYFGKNGAWLNGCNPATQTNPFNNHVNLATALYPAYDHYASGAKAAVTAIFGPTLTYSIPSGFEAWTLAGSGSEVAAEFDSVDIESVYMNHFHHDDPRLKDERVGVNLGRDIIYQNGTGDGYRAAHEHGDALSDETVADNIKRAYLRAWTATSAFAGIADAIIMYNGAVAPSGWALCDGSGGTPDLRDYFIMMSDDATQANAGNNTLTPALVTDEDGAHDHLWQYASAEYLLNTETVYHIQAQNAANGYHAHDVTTPVAYVPQYYALTFIMRTGDITADEAEPDQDALVVADTDGWQDDGSGTYTGTPSALIERPDHMLKHIIIAKLGLSASEIDSTSYTASGTAYASASYALALVVLQRPNSRLLIQRIAHQSKSIQFWEVGVHHLIYISTSEAVSKVMDMYRIDTRQLWLTWTDRADIKNSLSGNYNRDWSGHSDMVDGIRGAIIATDADSIADKGTLEGDPSNYPYITTEAQAQDVLDWELSDLKEPRQLIELAGGYYFTDLERGDVIEFTITEDDYLDLALLGTSKGLVWQDRPEVPLLFKDWTAVLPTVPNWDPDEKDVNVTLSNENLTASSEFSAWRGGLALGERSTGRWYFEVEIDTNQIGGRKAIIGVAGTAWDYTSTHLGGAAYSWGGDLQNGSTYAQGGGGASFAAATPLIDGDIFMVALDQDSTPPGIYWGKNGVWLHSGNPATFTNPADFHANLKSALYPAFALDGNASDPCTITADFGPTMTYTVPSGYEVWTIPGGGSTTLEFKDIVGQAKYRIIEQRRRGDGKIQLKMVEVGV